MLDPKHRQEEVSKREEDDIEDPLLRDLSADFFDNDPFDSPRPFSPPSSPYLAPTQPPARLANYKDPTSYTLHGSISNHHSASGEHHCNLACHPHCIKE